MKMLDTLCIAILVGAVLFFLYGRWNNPKQPWCYYTITKNAPTVAAAQSEAIQWALKTYAELALSVKCARIGDLWACQSRDGFCEREENRHFKREAESGDFSRQNAPRYAVSRSQRECIQLELGLGPAGYIAEMQQLNILYNTKDVREDEAIVETTITDLERGMSRTYFRTLSRCKEKLRIEQQQEQEEVSKYK